MKRKLSLILVLAIILSTVLCFPITSMAERHEEKDIKIWINGFYVMSDVHPFVENSRTYVPIRFIAEELGYDVKWNDSNWTVDISKGKTNIKLAIDSDIITVNGKQMKIDAPARLRDERTFIPIRAVAELMGETVSYDVDNNIAAIGEGFNPSNAYAVVFYNKNVEPIISEFKIQVPTQTVYYYDSARTYRSNLTISQNEFMESVYIMFIKHLNGEYYDSLGFVNKSSYNPSKYVMIVSLEQAENPTTSSTAYLKDEYYVKEDATDPLVGSWYGQTKRANSDEYYDSYVYIENTGNGEYLLTDRAIKQNGSELVTHQMATYNKSTKTLKFDRSFKTSVGTGDFDLDWFTYEGEKRYDGVNKLINPKDSKMYLERY